MSFPSADGLREGDGDEARDLDVASWRWLLCVSEAEEPGEGFAGRGGATSGPLAVPGCRGETADIGGADGATESASAVCGADSRRVAAC